MAKQSVVAACDRNRQIEAMPEAKRLQALSDAAHAAYRSAFCEAWPHLDERVFELREAARTAQSEHERFLTAQGWTDADDRLFMAIFDE